MIPLPEAAALGLKTGTRVRVFSRLNEGRYNGRLATVLQVYEVEGKSAGGSYPVEKVQVQLDRWSRGWEAPNGVLYLNVGEVVREDASAVTA